MNSMNLAISALTILLAVASNQTKPRGAVSDQRSAISRTEPGTAGSDETNPTPLSAQPPCPEGAAVCSQGRKPLENIALSVSWSPEGATEPLRDNLPPPEPTISENQTNPPPPPAPNAASLYETNPTTAIGNRPILSPLAEEVRATKAEARTRGVPNFGFRRFGFRLPYPSHSSLNDETNPPPPDSSLITHHSSLNSALSTQHSALNPSPSSFAALDIYIDPAGSPLAAYQIELLADPAQVAIVGIEGGSHPAFAEPPYYDPAALMNHRVIIAAFNTGKDLPTARTRVATIHVRITGDAKPSYEAKLQTAGDSEGKTFAPAVTVEERKPTSNSPGPAGTRESNDTRTQTTQQGANE